MLLELTVLAFKWHFYSAESGNPFFVSDLKQFNLGTSNQIQRFAKK